MKKSLLLLPILLLAALGAACGGSDQNSSNNGGNGGSGASNNGGNGGSGAASATAATRAAARPAVGAAAAAAPAAGAPAAAAPAAAQAGGGTGGPCGGKMGEPCAADAYCDFLDDICGAADGTGTCTPKPEACPDVYAPVCACDGMVYSNACDAAAAGLDVSLLGACPSPEGMFPCGSGFCVASQQYCQIQLSDVAGIPDTFSCVELPPNCQVPDAVCACLSDVECGETCMQEDGAFTLTCPGG